MQCHWLWARAVEPISRWDPSCTTETPDQLNSSPLPDPWPLRAALPFSASMSLNILGMLCKWDHAAFVRLWLAYFMEPVTLQVHPCCHKRWHFFLLEGRVLFSYTFNAHLDDSITSLSWTVLLCGTLGAQTSPADPEFKVFMCIPRRRIIGSSDSSSFNFWEISMFCMVAAPFYIFTNSVEGFWFLHILTNTCNILRVFLILDTQLSWDVICTSLWFASPC